MELVRCGSFPFSWISSRSESDTAAHGVTGERTILLEWKQMASLVNHIGKTTGASWNWKSVFIAKITTGRTRSVMGKLHHSQMSMLERLGHKNGLSQWQFVQDTIPSINKKKKWRFTLFWQLRIVRRLMIILRLRWILGRPELMTHWSARTQFLVIRSGYLVSYIEWV